MDVLIRNAIVENYCGVYATIINENDWLLAVQKCDTEIRNIKNILLFGDHTGNRQIFNDFDLRRGRIYRRTEYGNRAVIPKFCRWQIMRFNHGNILLFIR